MIKSLEDLDRKVSLVIEGLDSNVYVHPGLVKGSSGVVRVSANHVAKLAPNLEYLTEDEEGQRLVLRKLVNEGELLREAFEKGLRVPKPEGFFGIPVRNGYFFGLGKSRILVPGLVMQYVMGVTLDKVRTEDIADSRHSWLQELEHARELGFEPGDYRHLGNAIWNPLERQTYLIDLAWWGRKEGCNFIGNELLTGKV